MNLSQLKLRVRSLTRDFTNSIYREQDIIDYINEAINRIKTIMPELAGMTLLYGDNDTPIIFPEQYHHLLAVYCAARLHFQDEDAYQSSTLMNEFEVKMQELVTLVESGKIILVNPTTNQPVTLLSDVDYVVDNYFFKRDDDIDVDDGVEGVE